MKHTDEAKTFFGHKSREEIAAWLDDVFHSVHVDPSKDISAALFPMEAWYGRSDSYLDDLSAMCRESLSAKEQASFNEGVGTLLQRYASQHDIARVLLEDAIDLVGRLRAFEASESLFILLRDRGHDIPSLWYDALSTYATLSPAREIVDPVRKMVGLEEFPANYGIYAWQYLCEAHPAAWLDHWNHVRPKFETLASAIPAEERQNTLNSFYDLAAEILTEKVGQYLYGAGQSIDLSEDEILTDVISRLPADVYCNVMRPPHESEIQLPSSGNLKPTKRNSMYLSEQRFFATMELVSRDKPSLITIVKNKLLHAGVTRLGR